MPEIQLKIIRTRYCRLGSLYQESTNRRDSAVLERTLRDSICFNAPLKRYTNFLELAGGVIVAIALLSTDQNDPHAVGKLVVIYDPNRVKTDALFWLGDAEVSTFYVQDGWLIISKKDNLDSEHVDVTSEWETFAVKLDPIEKPLKIEGEPQFI